MTIDDALYSYLSTNAGLIALVSTRIYPEVLPKGTVQPAVVHQQISGPRIHAMGNDPGLTHPRWQFTVYAGTKLAAKGAAVKLREALQNYSGTMGGVDGVMVQRIYIEDEASGQDPDTGLFYVRQDYTIWHEE